MSLRVGPEVVVEVGRARDSEDSEDARVKEPAEILSEAAQHVPLTYIQGLLCWLQKQKAGGGLQGRGSPPSHRALAKPRQLPRWCRGASAFILNPAPCLSFRVLVTHLARH